MSVIETESLSPRAAAGPKSLRDRRAKPAVADQPPAAGSLFLKACRGEKTDRPPVWLMRQAGRYMKSYRDLRAKVSMLSLCKNPELCAQVTVDAADRLGVDAAIIFSDLLLILEPMGLRLDYPSGGGPRLRPAVDSRGAVNSLRTVHPRKDLGFVLEAIRKTRARLKAGMPLIGFAGAPFTLASYLIEGGGAKSFVRTKSFMYREPKAWHRLMSHLSQALADFLGAQAEAGAQALQIFDSWVGCLSPDDYKRFVLPHSRSVLRAVKKIPIIHFGTQTGDLLSLMKEAGGDVMGLDWRVNLATAREKLGDIPVMGNLDPAVLFSNSVEILSQVRRISKENAGRPGHIFNLGHGVLPGTPFSNVRYLVQAVKNGSHG